MATSDLPELIYLGRSRLHRNRANLIQTLHTVAALTEIGVATRLYLPPWHRSQSVERRLGEMGIQARLDIRPSQLLHRRWPPWAFGRFHRRLLRSARAVYVRSEKLSLALAELGIVHNFEVHTLQPLIQRGELERLVAFHRHGLIDRLIPISRNSAQRLIDAGADPERIHVSPSGVDLKAFQSISPTHASRLSHPRIVYLGRISRDRGMEILLHVAERGLGEVLLVGDCDDEVPASTHLSHRPAIPHREVASLYADCDLALMPYQTDLIHVDGISPMKLFEAMAAGRPIVASDIAPIREILRHGHNGRKR